MDAICERTGYVEGSVSLSYGATATYGNLVRLLQMANAKSALSEAIKARLEALGMSQGEFAKAIGKSRAWASQFLGGRRSVPTTVLDRIATVLTMEPWQLFYPVGRDLPRHTRTGSSAHEATGDSNVDTASQTRVLESIRTHNRRAAEEIEDAIGRLGKIAAALAREAGTPTKGATGSARSRRKAG